MQTMNFQPQAATKVLDDKNQFASYLFSFTFTDIVTSAVLLASSVTAQQPWLNSNKRQVDPRNRHRLPLRWRAMDRDLLRSDYGEEETRRLITENDGRIRVNGAIRESDGRLQTTTQMQKIHLFGDDWLTSQSFMRYAEDALEKLDDIIRLYVSVAFAVFMIINHGKTREYQCFAVKLFC